MKLSYKNNWEADEYYVDGQRILDLRVVEIGGVKYNVTSKVINVPYNDMGHVYHGVSKHFFIEEDVFGVTMKFDLNKLVGKLDVNAVEYDMKYEK
jgi:hypothetical protein